MADLDPPAEWNRLSQLYRGKSDDELENIAAEAYDLTDIAREVLASEIRERHLPIELTLEPRTDSDVEAPWEADEDFQLATVYKANSPEQLLTAARILDSVNTPYL